jgi:hypothetical protein
MALGSCGGSRSDRGANYNTTVRHGMTRRFSNLRADVRENAIMLEQMRDELRAMHELMGNMQEQLADVPKREDFDELRADAKGIKKVVGDHSGELTQLESQGSEPEAA